MYYFYSILYSLTLLAKLYDSIFQFLVHVARTLYFTLSTHVGHLTLEHGYGQTTIHFGPKNMHKFQNFAIVQTPTLNTVSLLGHFNLCMGTYYVNVY